MNVLMLERVFLYALSLHIRHKTIILCDCHGVSGETFFGLRLNIECANALGFCWSKFYEPWVFNPPVRECLEPTNGSIVET
jgi:hypothetical protein